MTPNEVTEMREELNTAERLTELGKSISKKNNLTTASTQKETIEDVRKKLFKNTTETEQKELVHNVIGSSGDDSSDTDTWIVFWEENKGETLPDTFTCPACKKTKKKKIYNDEGRMVDGAVGGHVQNKRGDIFICPICKKCNDKKDKLPPFYVGKEKILPLSLQKK